MYARSFFLAVVCMFPLVTSGQTVVWDQDDGVGTHFHATLDSSDVLRLVVTPAAGLLDGVAHYGVTVDYAASSGGFSGYLLGGDNSLTMTYSLNASFPWVDFYLVTTDGAGTAVDALGSTGWVDGSSWPGTGSGSSGGGGGSVPELITYPEVCTIAGVTFGALLLFYFGLLGPSYLVGLFRSVAAEKFD